MLARNRLGAIVCWATLKEKQMSRKAKVRLRRKGAKKTRRSWPVAFDQRESLGVAAVEKPQDQSVCVFLTHLTCLDQHDTRLRRRNPKMAAWAQVSRRYETWPSSFHRRLKPFSRTKHRRSFGTASETSALGFLFMSSQAHPPQPSKLLGSQPLSQAQSAVSAPVWTTPGRNSPILQKGQAKAVWTTPGHNSPKLKKGQAKRVWTTPGHNSPILQKGQAKAVWTTPGHNSPILQKGQAKAVWTTPGHNSPILKKGQAKAVWTTPGHNSPILQKGQAKAVWTTPGHNSPILQKGQAKAQSAVAS